jgi:hypothetical protein
MSKKGVTMLHVSFDVEASKLSLFMELLDKEVTNLDIKQVQRDETYQVQSRAPRSDKGSKRENRPSPMFDLAKDFVKEVGVGGTIISLANGKVTQLGNHLAAHGYAASSASSVISRLADIGLLKRIRKGEYQVVKTA